MRSTPGSRELGFVLVVALAGLALVLAVAFMPWYTVSADAVAVVPAAVVPATPTL
jgi:hypothetical protein